MNSFNAIITLLMEYGVERAVIYQIIPTERKKSNTVNKTDRSEALSALSGTFLHHAAINRQKNCVASIHALLAFCVFILTKG